jgi:hypothetical protein
VINIEVIHGDHPKDLVPELIEQGTLQRFRKIVRRHQFCGAVDNANLLLCHTIGDEEVANVYVPGSPAAGGFSILLHSNTRLIVLAQHTICAIALGFQEVSRPQDL